MKKQMSPKKPGLSLTKRTISNMEVSELSKQLGGVNANLHHGALMKGAPFTRNRRCWSF
jgi:hypothetical protein